MSQAALTVLCRGSDLGSGHEEGWGVSWTGVRALGETRS